MTAVDATIAYNVYATISNRKCVFIKASSLRRPLIPPPHTHTHTHKYCLPAYQWTSQAEETEPNTVSKDKQCVSTCYELCHWNKLWPHFLQDFNTLHCWFPHHFTIFFPLFHEETHCQCLIMHSCADTELEAEQSTVQRQWRGNTIWKANCKPANLLM